MVFVVGILPIQCYTTPMLNPLICALLGWLAGGLANLAADVLPASCTADAAPPRPSLSPWHLLTLAWYPFRRGICPHCGQRLPWRGPALEAATIVLFLAAWLRFGVAPALLAIAWLTITYLLVVLVVDLEHRRVLNVMLIPAVPAVLLLSFVPGMPGLLSALLGGAAGLGLFLLIAIVGRGALGAGDVKLAGLIGLITGYPDVLRALIYGMLLGGIAGLLLIAARKATRKSYMAYAPYLALGALIVLFTRLGQ